MGFMPDVQGSILAPHFHGRMLENTIFETESKFSPDSKSVGTFILDFSYSRTTSNRFRLYINYSLCDILLLYLKCTEIQNLGEVTKRKKEKHSQQSANNTLMPGVIIIPFHNVANQVEVINRLSSVEERIA
jgi:hypothetical protein